MKIRLITIAIALVYTAGFSDIGVGVKGGLSLYKAKNDQSFDFYNEFRPASDFSVFCAFESNKFLAHNILLTYYQAGGKSTFQGTDMHGNPDGNEWREVQKLNYLGVGYGFEFKMKMLNVFPIVSAGISLDYLVNIKEEMDSGENVEEVQSFDDSKFRKFNVRPFLTGALEYKINRIGIFAEYTFSYNVLPYYEEEKTTINSGIKYRTFGQFVNLGCKFYL
jgi:hypothetical protein